MQSLVPFVFENNLVRVVPRDGDPWFVATDVCTCLGLTKGRTSVDLLDADEKGAHSVGTPGGEQTMIVVNLPGLFALAFRSRKPAAKRFERWVRHEVLVSLVKTGRYDMAGAVAGDEPLPSVPATPTLYERDPHHAVELYREYRKSHSLEQAQAFWVKHGFPPGPRRAPTLVDEAHVALRHLLDAPAQADGPPIRQLVTAALEDDEEARLKLVAAGIRVLPESDAFVVANRAPRLTQIFAGTPWAGSWARVLRRIQGVEPQGPMRFEGLQKRGSLVPGALLDDAPEDQVLARLNTH